MIRTLASHKWRRGMAVMAALLAALGLYTVQGTFADTATTYGDPVTGVTVADARMDVQPDTPLYQVRVSFDIQGLQCNGSANSIRLHVVYGSVQGEQTG